MWPFTKRERRAEAESYTVQRLDADLARATQVSVDPRSTAVAVTASTLLGRSLQGAEVRGAGPVGAAVAAALFDVGRRLVLDGECFYVPSYDGGQFRLLPGTGDATHGGPLPESWTYLLTLNAPSQTRSTYYRADDVMHFRVNAEAATPWRGRTPLDSSTARALAAVEHAVEAEAKSPFGTIIGIPPRDDPGDIDKVAGAIKRLRGNHLVLDVPKQGEAQRGAMPYTPHRVGWNPPSAAVTMRADLEKSVAQSLGVPLELLSDSAAAASREGWRRYLHAVLQPTARLIESEVAMKTGETIEISLTRLAASDIMGRARSAAALAKAGWSVEDASRIAGLDS